MDQQMRMAKQMVDLQRTTFDGMITNMVMFWEQTQKSMGTYLDQAPWMPEECKMTMREWVNGNIKGCETFRKAVDDGYKTLDKCFMGGEQKPQREQSTQQAA